MKKNLLKLTLLATSVVLSLSVLTGCFSKPTSTPSTETSTEIAEGEEEIMEEENGMDIELEEGVNPEDVSFEIEYDAEAEDANEEDADVTPAE